MVVLQHLCHEIATWQLLNYLYKIPGFMGQSAFHRETRHFGCSGVSPRDNRVGDSIEQLEAKMM